MIKVNFPSTISVMTYYFNILEVEDGQGSVSYVCFEFKKKRFVYFNSMHMSILIAFMYVHQMFACMDYVYHMCVQCPQRPEEGTLRLELQPITGQSCRCWDLNLNPLQEQPVVLNTGPTSYPVGEG